MDTTNAPSNSRSGAAWTNEKHVHFLNSMEASFVHRMFEKKGHHHHHHHHHHLRLDRYLPDTSDSTLDLKQKRKKKQLQDASRSVDISGPTPRAGLDSRGERRPRRRPYQPHTSSEDQVVPHLESIRDDKDESDSANISAAPAN